MGKIYTLWDLYGSYMGVPSPPSPREWFTLQLFNKLFHKKEGLQSLSITSTVASTLPLK